MKTIETLELVSKFPMWLQILIGAWIFAGLIILIILIINIIIQQNEKQNLNIEFASIEMSTKDCLWEDFAFSNMDSVNYRSHLLPVFTWTNELVVSDNRIVDPILDISIINNIEKPVLLTKIGFQAIRFGTVKKGLPVIGKIRVIDAFELKVKEFIPYNDYMLKLPEKILMEPNSVYRFKLRLKEYCNSINGNESIIKISLEVNSKIVRSKNISLGFF